MNNSRACLVRKVRSKYSSPCQYAGIEKVGIVDDIRVARGQVLDQYLLWYRPIDGFSCMIHRPTSVGYPWEKDYE